jgi:hypothetical protein
MGLEKNFFFVAVRAINHEMNLEFNSNLNGQNNRLEECRKSTITCGQFNESDFCIDNSIVLLCHRYCTGNQTNRGKS